MNKKRNILIYAGHKYTSKNTDPVARAAEVAANCRHAAQVAAELMDLGFSVFDPLNNSDPQVEFTANTYYEDYLAMDFEIISRCDCVYMPSGYYEQSNGCNREIKFARSIGKPVFFNIEELTLHWQGVPDNEKTF